MSKETATHCNTPQHQTSTLCNTLQHTATHVEVRETCPKKCIFVTTNVQKRRVIIQNKATETYGPAWTISKKIEIEIELRNDMLQHVSMAERDWHTNSPV